MLVWSLRFHPVCFAFMRVGLADAVSAVLCSHFKVPSVLHLGYGPVEPLMQAAGDSDRWQQPQHQYQLDSRHSSSNSISQDTAAVSGTVHGSASAGGSVGAWAPLALSSSGASGFTARAGGLKPHHGIACLSAAPLMADLAAWSGWDSLYGPALGPLPAFLSQHR